MSNVIKGITLRLLWVGAKTSPRCTLSVPCSSELSGLAIATVCRAEGQTADYPTPKMLAAST